MDAAGVKEKALELGADLVGIASIESIVDIPPFNGDVGAVERLLKGAKSFVVVARRLLWGAARQRKSDDRSSHYAGELAISKLEEIALDLVMFLEDEGYPGLSVPAGYTRSHLVDMSTEGPISLPHAAVEAGLGTLGMNLMLLTPNFGPRVVLGGLLTTAELEPDGMLRGGLCLGESCGRCLLACPGEAVQGWNLDIEACRPHSSPYGYQFLENYVGRLMDANSKEERWDLLRGTDTLMIWQSMLRGVGIYTGCTRCYEVCPVGADYDRHLREVQEEIPEATSQKRERLASLQGSVGRNGHSQDFSQNRRWIGELQETL